MRGKEAIHRRGSRGKEGQEKVLWSDYKCRGTIMTEHDEGVGREVQYGGGVQRWRTKGGVEWWSTVAR